MYIDFASKFPKHDFQETLNSPSITEFKFGSEQEFFLLNS